MKALAAGLAFLAAGLAQAQADTPRLTLGGEARLRYERFENNEWGAARAPDEDYFRLRLLPYADLPLGARLRFFGQLQGAWSTRDQALKNPFTDETGIDVVQAFVDVQANGTTLRGGRQVLEYGAQRLISSGPNIRFAFDGALARWERRGARVDAFVVRPMTPRLDSFDDRTSRTEKLWAFYGTRTPWDLYYIGYRNEGALYNAGAGEERRHTLGTRHAGSRPPWNWDLEANLQRGDFAGQDIRAGSLDMALRHTWKHVARTPYAEVRLNFISGDKDRDDGRLGTFNPLFATGQFFGDIGQLGPMNLVNLRPNFGLHLDATWRLSAALTFYWRQRLEDGVYGPARNLLRPDGGSRARYVGTQGDVALDKGVSRKLSLRFVYAFFAPGRFIRETGPADTVHFVQANVVFTQ